MMTTLHHRLLPMIAFAGVVGAASVATAQSSNDLHVLKLAGERGWRIECEFERADDKPLRVRKRGRGDVETIAVRGATGGACDYVVEADHYGDLKITYTVNDDFPPNCPFATEAGQCIGRFSPGADGGFSF